MTPRPNHIGETTTMGTGTVDPAAHAVANDADSRISDFLAALRRPWWSEASCRGMGPELFHSTRRQREALAVCGGCVVMLQCRAESVADPTLHGIRGGMDDGARRNTRRNLKATQGAPVGDVEPTPHPSDPAAATSLRSEQGASTTAAGVGRGTTPAPAPDRRLGVSQCRHLSYHQPTEGDTPCHAMTATAHPGRAAKPVGSPQSGVTATAAIPTTYPRRNRPMTTDRITTDAQLSALSQDQIAAAWKAGEIDYEAIGAERQAAADATRRRAARIGDGIRAGLSHTDAAANADAAN